MRVAEYPLAQLHWAIRQDPWVRAIFLAAGVPLDALAERILDLASFEDSEAMLSRSLALWERILGLTPGKDASMDDRRRAVRAMWLACLPPSLAAIQAYCDNLMPGVIEAGYEPEQGLITLLYLIGYGAPPDLDPIKPAHLAVSAGLSRTCPLYALGYLQSCNLDIEIPVPMPDGT